MRNSSYKSVAQKVGTGTLSDFWKFIVGQAMLLSRSASQRVAHLQFLVCSGEMFVHPHAETVCARVNR